MVACLYHSNHKKNYRSILHDREVFHDPFAYNPDRYLKDGKIDTAIRDPNVAFFGLEEESALADTSARTRCFQSHLLAVYDIRPGLDEDGNEVEIKPEMTSGMLS